MVRLRWTWTLWSPFWRWVLILFFLVYRGREMHRSANGPPIYMMLDLHVVMLIISWYCSDIGRVLGVIVFSAHFGRKSQFSLSSFINHCITKISPGVYEVSVQEANRSRPVSFLIVLVRSSYSRKEYYQGFLQGQLSLRTSKEQVAYCRARKGSLHHGHKGFGEDPKSFFCGYSNSHNMYYFHNTSTRSGRALIHDRDGQLYEQSARKHAGR